MVIAGDDAGRARQKKRISLAADERARVPFALIGVLLIVSASAYAAGITGQGLIREDKSVERATERVDADATAALRHAAREAAYASAAKPVTRPPEGSASDAPVRAESAFEDAFRIRAGLAGHAALAAVNASVGDVTARASFEQVNEPLTPADLIPLRETVAVSPVANGTATRVVFKNVTISTHRDGRVITQTTRDRAVVVAVPTLAAHERTERFETRLNNGPVEGPGLGRQLTASLYPITWARGYGQYGKVPIQNVLANRHVELSTNAGIVRTQRSVFGASDPDARGGVAVATAKTGLTDLLGATKYDGAAWSDAVLGSPAAAAHADDNDGFAAARSHSDETRAVDVGHSADVAAVTVTDDLESIARESHRVEATLTVDADRRRYGGRPRPPHPNPSEDGWRRVDVETDETVRVRSSSRVPASMPTGVVRPGESVGFGSTTRTVFLERTVEARWERTVERLYTIPVPGDAPPIVSTREVVAGRETTRASATDRYRVSVRVRGAHAPRDEAPRRPAATFGAGSVPGATDLTDTPGAARDALGVSTASAVDRLAVRAVESGDIHRSTAVFGHVTDHTRDRIAADLDGLRTEVRDIETSLSMESMARGDAAPYEALAETVRDRRQALVDAPRRYDGAGDRARVAARIAYLDAVLEEIEKASETQSTTAAAFRSRVQAAFGGPSIGAIIASKEAARDVDPYTVGETGPGGGVTFVPDAAPGYLPRTPVDGADIDAIDGTTRPLATRNINYVTMPYDDISQGIVGVLLGSSDQVDVGTAGRALLAADRSLAGRTDPDQRADRNALARRLESSLSLVESELIDVLADHTEMTRGERRRAVERATAAYDTTGARAIAVGDGTYAERVADEAARVGGLSDGERSALAARLRVATVRATGRDAVRIPAGLVDEPTRAAREQTRNELARGVRMGTEAAVANASERWMPENATRVGAGLPVAPVPAYWVATVNAWRVQVRGEYPRFTLTADVGPPGRSFKYVREAGVVTVPVGEDTVQLGVTEPVQFETGTVIVIAVPPGPPGVGDVDGTRDEQSPGW